MTTRHFDLAVWDRSHRLTGALHLLSRRLPPQEFAGLGTELCAAAAAVPTHLAESVREEALADQLRHINEAERRAYETQGLLLLLAELPYLNRDTVRALAGQMQQIQKMIADYKLSVARGEYL